MTLRRGAAATQAIGLAAFLLAHHARAADLAIEHAQLHTGDGKKIDDGTVIVRGETILAVGASAEVRVPEGARRLDARGTWVTPGLIDAEALTGTVEVTQEDSTDDSGLDARYDAIRAAFSALDGLNPRSVVIPVTRLEGVTSTVLVPRGGLVSGRQAVVHLLGDSVEELVIRAPAAIYATAAGHGRAAAFGARGGVMLRLRELFDDVRQYARRRQDFERNQMRKVTASRLDLEALIPVVEGKLPLVVEAHRASDLQALLRFAREQKIRLVISGGQEAWMVARELAAARVPVIVSALPDLPGAFETLGARLENAALLARAGVSIAISPREEEGPFSRTLRIEAGNAVAHGLPWEAGLTAITRAPAEIFGVAGTVGTIAPGRSADLVVWTGDPFEPLTRPRTVIIRGREVPLHSRQTELRDRYRDLRVEGLRP
jgi:imidazolonepropionase-like amidohydrolase